MSSFFTLSVCFDVVSNFIVLFLSFNFLRESLGWKLAINQLQMKYLTMAVHKGLKLRRIKLQLNTFTFRIGDLNQHSSTGVNGAP